MDAGYFEGLFSKGSDGSYACDWGCLLTNGLWGLGGFCTKSMGMMKLCSQWVQV